MTNQNMVTQAGKSCVNNNNTLMELAMSISNSCVLPRATTVPELMAFLGGFLGQQPNKNKKTLEDGKSGGPKVNTWIDSMRASSPTRTKSTQPCDQNPWTVSIY